MGKYILLASFLFSIITGYSQDFNAATWNHIDTSIKKKDHLSDINDLIQQLRQKAWAEKKYFDLARCYYYEIQIADQRTEDSFYFRNSAVYDSLLMTQKDKPQLQFTIELLLAKRLSGFQEKYHRFDISKYGRRQLMVDYTLFSDKERDSIALVHFEKAKTLAKNISFADTAKILWLSSDPFLFVFKPGPFDIAITEQIKSRYIWYYPSSPVPAAKLKLIKLPQDTFISQLDSFYKDDKAYFKELNYYREWLNYHAADTEPFYYIETLLRENIYETIKGNRSPGPGFDEDYEIYLQQVSLSKHNEARAHAVFQLCLIWEKQSGQYFPRGRFREYGYDYRKRDYGDISGYDTAYRYHAAKALRLFEQNKTLLDSFIYFKKILLAMEKKILAKQVNISLQEYNLPNELMLAELTYKNAGKLYYSIVRMNAGFKFSYDDKDTLTEKLRQLPEMASNRIDIPVTDDHNWHEVYIKLDGLSAGTYSLLFSPDPINDANKHVERIYLKISSVAVVTNKKYVFVLDRKTGFPLAGATVRGEYAPDPKDSTGLKKIKSKSYIVNEQGFVIINDEKIEKLEVYYKNDTSFARFAFPDDETPDEVYTKDDYDGLADFYETNASVHVFTDRSIYRPGQTVHFKAIFLTTNKKTGEAMLMSKENMGTSFFKSVYKKWLKESDPEIYLSDPFDRKVDTIKIKLNEYGSISGSFKIPKTAATGEWSLDPGYLEKMGGSFRVEEYKRPTYEIVIGNPQKQLLPGDTFTVKVKATSFAGSAMNNVRLHYTIKRTGRLPIFDTLLEKIINKDHDVTIIDTITYTNAEGELNILVKDDELKQFSLAKDERWDFEYSLAAEATDGTGETHEDNTNITVSSRPVIIDLTVKETYNRNEKNAILITAQDRNTGTVSKNIRVKIYKLLRDEKIYNDRRLTRADQWLYSKEQLEKWFPLTDIRLIKDSITRQLVIDKTIVTGNIERLDIDPALFVAGNYIIEASCEENGGLLGKNQDYFSVFDEKENKLAMPSYEFYHLPYNSVSPGDTLKYYNGNSEGTIYSIYYLSWYSVKKKLLLTGHYEMVKQESGVHQWKWKVPADAKDKLLLTQAYVFNNQLFTNEEVITIDNSSTADPEIIIEQYRKKLLPGSKETFSISVKTKNDNTAAELMTTLYDASLDKLEAHLWEKPEITPDLDLESDWDASINSTINIYSYSYNYYSYRNGYLWLSSADLFPSRRGSTDLPVNYNTLANFEFENQLGLSGYAGSRGEDVMADWSSIPGNFVFQHDMNPDVRWSGNRLGFAYDSDGDGVSFSRIGLGSQMQFSRLSVTGALANQRGKRNYEREDVARYLYCPSFITPGVGAFQKGITPEVTAVPFLRISPDARSGSYNAVSIKDIQSLASFSQPLIIIDGVVFNGDLNTIDMATITMGIILKGAEATELYGPGAANGVLVLSTKGDIIFPQPSMNPPVPSRKNFNETAFFFPAIYADKDGYYKFTFTMPESVTEWNWKMLAHTKKARFAYAERKLNTQLPLMIQPNMPRLLYQGDRIVLQSRISNLDSTDAKGKAICKIEDVVTGEDVTSSFVVKTQNDFSVSKKTNISSAFEIKIPKTQINPIKIIISVRSQNFTDGEEHIIPVLSPKVLVRESIPFRFATNTDTTLQPPVLPVDAELYGVGISILPKPQSALINALPYLANYSFDCAEQTFNKLRAYVTAIKIMRTDKEAQQSFEKAKQVVEKLPEQKEQLPDELNEQAMPWLNVANKTIKQQKQLFELLDTNQAITQINKHLDKLFKLQNSDGGLTWFEGGKSNPYISNYVLAGFGKLRRDSMAILSVSVEEKYSAFIEKLLTYFENPIYKTTFPDFLFFAYARSFWINTYPLSDSSAEMFRHSLKDKWDRVNNSLYNKALLIITILRYFDKGSDEYQKAIRQLNSIEQLAIKDDINGIRWKDIADGDDMSNSAEETLALLAEAFAEADVKPEIFPGIIKWLLTAKNEDHWSSTKATSAVVGMLLKENKTAAGETQTINGSINNKRFSVTDDLLSGSSFSFINENKAMPVELKKEDNAPASGNIMWYYFSSGDNLSKANKEVNPIAIGLKKELFRYNSVMAVWEPVNEKTTLKIADKIKCVLTIETAKALKYIYIDDKRAAAFEPKENHSGYEYAQGFSYYQSIRDAGIQFFSDFIPSGRSTISYEMIVAQEGNFKNGPALLQCMYKPEVTAYSNSITVQAVK